MFFLKLIYIIRAYPYVRNGQLFFLIKACQNCPIDVELQMVINIIFVCYKYPIERILETKFSILSKASLKSSPKNISKQNHIFKQFCNKFKYSFVYTFILIICLFSSDTLQVFMFVYPTVKFQCFALSILSSLFFIVLPYIMQNKK